MNKVILMGRLTKEPELRHTTTDKPVTSFTLAVDRGFRTNGERQADFINCVAWNGTAEFVAKWFSKGQPMALSGRIQSRTYKDKDGKNRAAVEVVADEVFFAEGKRGESEARTAELPPPEMEYEELIGDNEPLPF